MKTTVGSLVIVPAASEFTLDALVAEITDVNRDDETETGNAVGKEIW
jgi:antitoxin component of MazEF toxin-antitoxin module